jgi:hypothetical protein
LIEARGHWVAMAGAALLPLPLVIALTSPPMGKLAVSSGKRAIVDRAYHRRRGLRALPLGSESRAVLGRRRSPRY